MLSVFGKRHEGFGVTGKGQFINDVTDLLGDQGFCDGSLFTKKRDDWGVGCPKLSNLA